MMEILNKSDMIRLVKFCCVGGFGVFIGIGLLFMFTDIFGLFYILSAILSFFIGLIYHYLANNYWTFSDMQNDNLFIGGIKFMMISILYFLFHLVILFVLTSIFEVYYLVSAMFAILTGFMLKYVLSYFWVWRVH